MAKVLERIEMEDCKPVARPLEAGMKLPNGTVSGDRRRNGKGQEFTVPGKTGTVQRESTLGTVTDL